MDKLLTEKSLVSLARRQADTISGTFTALILCYEMRGRNKDAGRGNEDFSLRKL